MYTPWFTEMEIQTNFVGPKSITIGSISKYKMDIKMNKTALNTEKPSATLDQ